VYDAVAVEAISHVGEIAATMKRSSPPTSTTSFKRRTEATPVALVAVTDVAPIAAVAVGDTVAVECNLVSYQY